MLFLYHNIIKKNVSQKQNVQWYYTRKEMYHFVNKKFFVYLKYVLCLYLFSHVIKIMWIFFSTTLRNIHCFWHSDITLSKLNVQNLRVGLHKQCNKQVFEFLTTFTLAKDRKKQCKFIVLLEFNSTFSSLVSSHVLIYVGTFFNSCLIYSGSWW